MNHYQKAVIVMGLIMAAVSQSALAARDTGVCVFGNETVDSVVCYGPTVMKQTIVKGDINVTGTLRAENISARNVHVEGSAELRNSVVSQALKVTGSLSADNVQFKQGIAVESDDVVLNNSKVNGMVNITSPTSIPYLQVQCGTVVTGAVMFDGKAGVVQITGDALVQGKVVNGAMEFVKRDCGS